MFIQGLAGMSRRLYDGGAQYIHVQDTLNLHKMISMSAWGLALFQLPFIINILWSLFKGKKVESDNPWRATTLEWATPTPPGHGNFVTTPTVYRGPYEYSAPGSQEDFLPQNKPEAQ
jgi:cytochrome c oxidase subunit 1